jgi:hypothetical protein
VHATVVLKGRRKAKQRVIKEDENKVKPSRVFVSLFIPFKSGNSLLILSWSLLMKGASSWYDAKESVGKGRTPRAL